MLALSEGALLLLLLSLSVASIVPLPTEGGLVGLTDGLLEGLVEGWLVGLTDGLLEGLVEG